MKRKKPGFYAEPGFLIEPQILGVNAHFFKRQKFVWRWLLLKFELSIADGNEVADAEDDGFVDRHIVKECAITATEVFEPPLLAAQDDEGVFGRGVTVVYDNGVATGTAQTGNGGEGEEGIVGNRGRVASHHP